MAMRVGVLTSARVRMSVAARLGAQAVPLLLLTATWANRVWPRTCCLVGLYPPQRLPRLIRRLASRLKFVWVLVQALVRPLSWAATRLRSVWTWLRLSPRRLRGTVLVQRVRMSPRCLVLSPLCRAARSPCLLLSDFLSRLNMLPRIPWMRLVRARAREPCRQACLTLVLVCLMRTVEWA